MTKPLVSVITPTWQRHERLLNRCIPSVQAQAYPRVEHVIVSDGPDDELADKIAERQEANAFYHPVLFLSLPEHDSSKHWGHIARAEGIDAAQGEYIAYVDDDDSLRPDHVRLLASVLDDPTLDWAYSVMRSHNGPSSWTDIGWLSPAKCAIGTPMIMHRRELLEHGTWGPASPTEDWELVERWMKAGKQYGRVAEVTVDVWPSASHEHFLPAW